MDKIEKYFVADFETSDNRTYKENGKIDRENTQAWVWLWCLMDTDDYSYITGRSIEDFFNHLFTISENFKNINIDFCNLKFDGSFIIYQLEAMGWQEKEALRSNKRFKTLIDTEGNYYHITMRHNGCNITFTDSLKKIPMSIEDLAEALKLDTKKGSIDYSRIIYPQDEITQDDIDYCVNDCYILAQALKRVLYDRGFYRLTAASNALSHFKQLNTCFFRYMFPELSEEEDFFVRKSFRGGLCLTNDVKEYDGDIYVLDKNSMYPSMMHSISHNQLPMGKGEYFRGPYVYDKYRPLYVCRVYATMKLKPGHFPCIGEKYFFQRAQEFITECEYKELYLTNVDLENVKENYDIEQLDFLDGYKYQPSEGVFNKYINYWYKLKEEATNTGDMFTRVCAKLFLNSLFGKFGQKTLVGKQRLEMNDKGLLETNRMPLKECEGIYIPMAAFITAYARRDLLRAANMLGGTNTVLYMDTDSIHTTNKDFAQFLKIDNSKLNCWKLENIAQKGIYIKQKTYAECINGEWVLKCSGLSKKAKASISVNDLKKALTDGIEVSGNLKMTRVKGGCILEPCTFILK